ncbi:MAG: FAD:protein FMN transferase [Lachnospiraceae bacterium]
MIIRKSVVVGLIAVTLLLSGCSKASTEASTDFFAMDTYMSLSATGAEAEVALTTCRTFISELEYMISRTEEASEIYALNHSGGEVVVVSDMTYDIISIAVACAQATDGAFDPTICAITDLWGIGSDTAAIPSESAITQALETVSYENILLLEDNGVQLLNGAQIDLGAVGKGYAADVLYSIYEEYEIESGIIALGGNLYLVGKKEKDTPWSVGIIDPDYSEEYSIGVQVIDRSVVTTGAYERYFEEDGQLYHHIFDTNTGYPTQEDIKSVTIVSASSTLADIYATALFTMGYEDAISFVESQTDIAAIIIREDDTVYVSDDLCNGVSLDEKYTFVTSSE